MLELLCMVRLAPRLRRVCLLNTWWRLISLVFCGSRRVWLRTLTNLLIGLLRSVANLLCKVNLRALLVRLNCPLCILRLVNWRPVFVSVRPRRLRSLITTRMLILVCLMSQRVVTSMAASLVVLKLLSTLVKLMIYSVLWIPYRRLLADFMRRWLVLRSWLKLKLTAMRRVRVKVILLLLFLTLSLWMILVLTSLLRCRS